MVKLPLNYLCKQRWRLFCDHRLAILDLRQLGLLLLNLFYAMSLARCLARRISHLRQQFSVWINLLLRGFSRHVTSWRFHGALFDALNKIFVATSAYSWVVWHHFFAISWHLVLVIDRRVWMQFTELVYLMSTARRLRSFVEQAWAMSLAHLGASRLVHSFHQRAVIDIEHAIALK